MCYYSDTRMRRRITLLILLGFPIYFPLQSLIRGTIPHWYDTARALLLGLENLEKIRLIGHEGGIPGIFYGPHWIWLLSLVQIFSKNPVVVATFVLLIPYFTIIPFLLYKFKSFFGSFTVSLLWLLFILTYYSNSIHLWHIHLAPIIFLALVYLVVTINWDKDLESNILRISTAGFLSGVLNQLHMSFGSVMFISTSSYIFLNILLSFRQKKKWKAIFPYTVGVLVAIMPFILFEVRHQFTQTKRIIYVLSQSFLYNSAVVGQLGLTKIEIIDTFFKIPAVLFQFPKQLTYIWWFIALFLLLYSLLKKNFKLSLLEKRLVVLLLLCSSVLLTAYISSKNPIWVYQFTGAEIIFLLFTGLFAAKFPLVRTFLFIWVVWISFSTVYKSTTTKPIDPLTVPTLYTKKYIVDSVYKDANEKPFSVFVYSPSIYTFDYDYLFKWLGKDVYHYEPESNKNTVYLIIPDNKWWIRDDFINYKTPNNEYETAKQWQIGENTFVFKREKSDIAK